MTREDAEGLIAHAADAIDYGVEISEASMSKILTLARLGAKVMAPTEDEVKVAIDAWFLPSLRTAPIPEEFIRRMRAALSALQDRQP